MLAATVGLCILVAVATNGVNRYRMLNNYPKLTAGPNKMVSEGGNGNNISNDCEIDEGNIRATESRLVGVEHSMK